MSTKGETPTRLPIPMVRKRSYAGRNIPAHFQMLADGSKNWLMAGVFRAGTPDPAKVGPVVAYLASNECDDITGRTNFAGGNRIAYYPEVDQSKNATINADGWTARTLQKSSISRSRRARTTSIPATSRRPRRRRQPVSAPTGYRTAMSPLSLEAGAESARRLWPPHSTSKRRAGTEPESAASTT